MMERRFAQKQRMRQVMMEDQTREDDRERLALFHILTGSNHLYSRLSEIYDVKNHCIYPDCLGPGEVDFSHSSSRLIALAFNLFNGYPADVFNTLSYLDEDNFELAMEAIRIRFDARK